MQGRRFLYTLNTCLSCEVWRDTVNWSMPCGVGQPNECALPESAVLRDMPGGRYCYYCILLVPAGISARLSTVDTLDGGFTEAA